MAVDKPAIKRLHKAAKVARRTTRRTKSAAPAKASSSSASPSQKQSSKASSRSAAAASRRSPRDPVILTTGPLIPLPDCTNDVKLLEEIRRINKLRSKNAASLGEDSEDELDVLGSQSGSNGATVATLDFLGGFRGKEKLALAIQLHRPFTVGYDEDNHYQIETSTAEGLSFRIFAYHCDAEGRPVVTVSCEDRSQPGLGIIWNGRQICQDAVLLSHGDVIEAGQQRFTFHSKTDSMRAWGTRGEAERKSRFEYSARILGSGTHAQVVLAWDHRSRRQVACKRYKDTSSTLSADVEVKLLSKMRHPNLNGLLNFDIERLPDGQTVTHVIVDVAKGGDLFSYIHQYHGSRGLGGLDEAQCKWITYQMLRGLEYMHYQHGIAHHDLKPENVILVTASTHFPHIQIADFGASYEALPVVKALARRQKDPEANEAEVDKAMRVPLSKETHMGTTIYNPPEFLLNHGTKSPGYSPFILDSWSLGCTVFMLMFGNHPMPMMANLSHISTDVDPQPIMLALEAGTADDLARRGKIERSHVTVLRVVFGGLRWELLPNCQPQPMAKSFLEGLFTVDVAKRYTIAQALKSHWITDSQAELDEMYRCRVLGEQRHLASSASQQ